MTAAGDICWRRSFPGRNPSHIEIAGPHLACSYVDDQGRGREPGPCKLVCLDLEGNECWTGRDFALVGALADDRLLGVTQAGALRVLDVEGRESDGLRDGTKLVGCNDVVNVEATDVGFAVRTQREILVANRSLHLLDRFQAPSQRGGIVANGELMYLDGDKIVRRDHRGNDETLCQIPISMAHAAMNRWEQDTGTPALYGVATARIDPNADLPSQIVAALTNPSKRTSLGMGARLPLFHWTLSYVEATRTLFLTNHIHPHLLLCVGLDGNAKWCTYISPGCCGDGPVSLSSGGLVASSGCGGILTWLDPTGRITGRTQPHDGEGLAIAYESRVRALSDSSCIVSGGPGIMSYAVDGSLRWAWKEECSVFDYDEQLGVLVTALWADVEGDKKEVSITCVKNLDGRQVIA